MCSDGASGSRFNHGLSQSGYHVWPHHLAMVFFQVDRSEELGEEFCKAPGLKGLR